MVTREEATNKELEEALETMNDIYYEDGLSGKPRLRRLYTVEELSKHKESYNLLKQAIQRIPELESEIEGQKNTISALYQVQKELVLEKSTSINKLNAIRDVYNETWAYTCKCMGVTNPSDESIKIYKYNKIKSILNEVK